MPQDQTHAPWPVHPDSIKARVLREIVRDIQRILWLDEMEADEQGGQGAVTYFWNPDKEWSPDTLEEIADVLAEHGLNVLP